MADKKADTNESPEQKFLSKVQKRLKKCVDADKDNRKDAIDDLNFLNGDQWDQGEKNRRSISGRPMLKINLLPKFVDQVVGEMRSSRPSIKIRPVDDNADVAMARIREGIVRNIEYLSNAAAIYDQAAEMQVSCGYGAWRVLTRYTEENPFLQEIYLEAVPNPFMVFLDPDSKDPTGADARYGFVLEKMPRSKFEEEYDVDAPSDSFKTGQGLSKELWYDKDTVTVAEYFEKDTETIEMLQLEDGRVVTNDEFKEIHRIWEDQVKATELKAMQGASQLPTPTGAPQAPGKSMPQGAPPSPQGLLPGAASPAPQGVQNPALPQGGTPAKMPQSSQLPQINAQNVDQQPMPMAKKPEPKVKKRRDTEKTVINHWICTCTDILEGDLDGDRIAGKFIPLILVYGKERNIEGKRYVRGLIRDAKDPQKLINYWNTTAAETIALAPKAPWIGTAKQFEGYENDYASANTENYPFLKYNMDGEAPPPSRIAAAQPPVAVFEQIRRGEENLKSVIGMFNSDMGDAGPERTGAAITARQKPGDIATLIFLENLGRGVAHTGQIICEMIPEIYDTERDLRLRNIDESETFVPVNTTTADALKQIEDYPERYVGFDKKRLIGAIRKYGPDAKFNEMTAGKYDVVVTTGPSYSTQRQESSEMLMRLAQAMPEQMKLAGDLIVKNMDFVGSDEISDRIRKTLPPHLIKLKEGEEPAPTPPPPPMVQIQMMKLENEKLKQQTAQARAKESEMKITREIKKMESDDRNRMMDLMEQKKINDADIHKANMELVKMNMELQHGAQDHQIQTGMEFQKHQQQLAQQQQKHEMGLQQAGQKHEHGLNQAQQKMQHDQEMHAARLAAQSQAQQGAE